METLWLIKIGEITLKKGNRGYFERILKENIKRKLRKYGSGESSSATAEKPLISISSRAGRYFLETTLPVDVVKRALETTSGVVAFSQAKRVGKNIEELSDATVGAARTFIASGSGKRFKLEVRRTDKSLPLDSYGYARELGGRVLDALPELTVDVHKPDFVVRIELREWGYVYGAQWPGPGGLPVGTAGKGMLLLSGGIDSPVAGFLMAKRGLRLSAVHFHTPPYTSEESHDKVKRLASILAPWCDGLVMMSVPFTECQVKINKSVDRAATTLHTRAAMMRIAEILSERRGALCLVTGESLGQVASQTLESMAFTDRAADLPIFRPLIGLDKEEIIVLSRRVGSYETSVEPFDDCCTLFSPEHPLTRPDAIAEWAVFDDIQGLEALMDQAAEKTEMVRFDSRGNEINK